MEAVSHSRRRGSASLAFFAGLNPRTWIASPRVGGREASSSPLAAVRDAVKIALYRLIGLNAWAERRLDIYLSLRAYRKTFGQNPNLAQPSLFTEKVTARKLFERRPVFSILADKLRAREFARERIGPDYLPRLLMVCERFDEIDFDRLPDKFVIKANHGTHWVLIVEDKATLDRAAARRSINRWLKTNYYINSREYFYRNIRPRIMIEELLQEDSGIPVIEYRFFSYDGVAKFLSVHRQRSVNGGRTQTRFTRAGERLPDPAISSAVPADAPPHFADTDFPPNMERMFEIADTLAQGFDFIRVDLYNPGGRILFGEMTSLPMGGVRRMNPPIYNQMFGQEWNLKLG